MSKDDTNRVGLSSVYPYYQRLLAQANLQFTEPAQEMANEVKANLAAQGAGAHGPTTPQLELARP